MPSLIYTLKRSIKKLFEATTDVLAKSQRFIQHFTNCSSDNEKLLKTQRIMGSEAVPISYVEDVTANWDSTNTMLKRILRLRSSIDTLVRIVKEISEEPLSPSFHEVLLTEADYVKIISLAQLWDPLACAARTLQTSHITNASHVYPLTRMLLSLYEKYVEDDVINQVRKEILRDLKERWRNPSDAHKFACFLDPRF